ncbi:MAG TPA: ABC transporter ATP-binding protein, partial [Clostridiaceae bacterium]|nr:ABC transporter ATP-binding protein [Clostridiaceae bacterium]
MDKHPGKGMAHGYRAGRGMRHAGGPMGFAMPGEKAKDFKGTLKRLVGYLKPYKINLIVVLVFAIASTVFTIVSPQIQRKAVNKLQDGFVARMVLKKASEMQKEGLEQLKRLMQQNMQAKENAQVEIDPEALKAVKEFIELPLLDEAEDPQEKAEICRKMIELGGKLAELRKDLQEDEQGDTQQSFEMTQEQLDDALRAVSETEGKIDFGYIGTVLLILLGVYLLSSLFSLVMGLVMSGVAQKTVYNLRKDVDNKLSRLPLKYFDGRTHGEILSRVTNDIDTIAFTLQQSLTQVITSVVQIAGFIIMMLSISPVLTLIVLATMPLYVIATTSVVRRSQKYFAAQQKELGGLSGHVEETYAGHKIVKAFGREKKSMEKFRDINDRLYEAGWKAQFVSGIMFPLMNFISNLGYVLICIAGGVWMTKNRLALGDITAFIQYSRSFTHPIVQTANIANVIQSTVACAERVFEVL